MNAQMRLFLIAPELARLAEEATNMAVSHGNIRQQHHEFSKSEEWQEKQADQLKNVILAYHDPFTFDGEDLMSLINHTVMPDRVVHAMCNLGTADNDAYKAFVQDRITNGTVS